MARYTDRWGLSILGPGDTLSAQGYKAVDADRRLIDRLLAYATEGHHHTGLTGQDRTPTAGPNLTLHTTGGGMTSGVRYFYAYTVVDDTGNESAASPAIPINTPVATAIPLAPTLSYLTGTGALQPGTYTYVVSAYKGASNALETKATNSAAITIPSTSPANSVSVTLPTLPLGATGLNIYRKSPSGMHFLYIDSVANPTPGDAWVDDGSITGDCDRSLPPTNRTSNSNWVTVAFPGATPDLPDGWSWRIYRSQNNANWSRSFLAEVAPVGATPYTPLEYEDHGGATRVGAPPTVAQLINEPSKIELTDAAEVTGYLPPGRLVVPHVVTFNEPGPVTTGEGTFVWVCPFEQADIVYARAHLGVGSTPADVAVIVDVNASRPSQGTNSWDSIYGDGPDRPSIPQGENVGEPSNTPTIRHLEFGDALAIDVDQAGGGATPTDENLTVNVLMYVKHGSETDSYGWA